MQSSAALYPQSTDTLVELKGTYYQWSQNSNQNLFKQTEPDQLAVKIMLFTCCSGKKKKNAEKTFTVICSSIYSLTWKDKLTNEKVL